MRAVNLEFASRMSVCPGNACTWVCTEAAVKMQPTSSHFLQPVHGQAIEPFYKGFSSTAGLALDELTVSKKLVREMAVENHPLVGNFTQERDTRRELVDEIDVIGSGSSREKEMKGEMQLAEVREEDVSLAG